MKDCFLGMLTGCYLYPGIIPKVSNTFYPHNGRSVSAASFADTSIHFKEGFYILCKCMSQVNKSIIRVTP